MEIKPATKQTTEKKRLAELKAYQIASTAHLLAFGAAHIRYQLAQENQ